MTQSIARCTGDNNILSSKAKLIRSRSPVRNCDKPWINGMIRHFLSRVMAFPFEQIEMVAWSTEAVNEGIFLRISFC